MVKSPLAFGSLGLTVALTACSLAPPYHEPPSTQAPPAAYREAGDWQRAQPAEAIPRGAWWGVFRDHQLDAFEQQLTASNQDLRAAFARLQQARAQLQYVRADYFPTVTASAVAARTRTSVNAPQYSSSKPPTQNDLLLAGDLSYEFDVFGRVRNSVAAAHASAQASAADLAVVDLALHAELAVDYFTLRSEDARQTLLDETVAAYTRAAQLTENLYQGGAAPLTDVAQAQAQLQTALTQAEEVRLQRSQIEHAIAVLVNAQASRFHIEPIPLATEAAPPVLAPGLPSTLLERRPDVAAAERLVASANANIGVARAAYFPVFNLTAALGLQSTTASNWFTAPSELWALGPSALVTLFDVGRRRAQTTGAHAAYDEAVADYRATVVVAYQEVEDALTALRHLRQESESASAAVEAARTELEQANDRYNAGIVNYLEVVIAQNVLLSAQLSAEDIQVRRLIASVLLVKALGGGWEGQEGALQE